MISVEQARALVKQMVSPLDNIESELSAARGMVLAEPIAADAFYPSDDRSMMDGYVLRSDEAPGEFQISETIQAGVTPKLALEKGQAARIFTGALLPENGGRVIMQEVAERTGNTVKITEFPEREFIRKKGAEASPGQELLSRGTQLGPVELAILAQVGAVKPKLVRQPVVRHIATGNEIVSPAETPAPGQIRDTNSSLMSALFSELGIADFSTARCEDDLELLVQHASEPCDLLLISGGAGAGDFDFGAEALRQMGFTIHFDRVNLRPGKPLTFATKGRQAAFILPGNPVSHFVCFHSVVRLAAEQMSGRSEHWSFVDLELLDASALKPDPRETYWPARVSVVDGHLRVSPKNWSSSGDTFSLAGTNALVRVNQSTPANGTAQTLLLDSSARA